LLIFFGVWGVERRRRNAAKRRDKFEKLKDEMARHGGKMPKEFDKNAKGKSKVAWHKKFTDNYCKSLPE